MSTARPFHEYEDWPAANSTVRVPRLSEAQARKLIEGLDLVEERSVTEAQRGYVIRKYRNPTSGDFRYVGGVFAEW